jgi:DNA-directed RNA polymerase specialized sigma24 family protein
LLSPTLDSVTALLDRLKDGDHEAVGPLWQRYYPRLVALARKKLHGSARRVADEEDAALNAFDSFCRRAEQGHFPELNDRDGLWALLAQLTSRKAANMVRHHLSEKRGGGQVQGDSALLAADGDSSAAGFDAVEDNGTTPEEAAILAEEMERLLSGLHDPRLRQAALWKLEGYSNAEIATGQRCSEATVERRFAIIRRLLKKN